MRNIICNLLILGALFISTQYKGQHLLEALDAPSALDNVGPSDPNNPILDPGLNYGELCSASGYYWTGASCLCDSNSRQSANLIKVEGRYRYICGTGNFDPNDPCLRGADCTSSTRREENN